MPRQSPAFTQADIARAAKGAVAAGLTVYRVEVEPEGRIVVVTSEPPKGSSSSLESWLEKRNARAAEGT